MTKCSVRGCADEATATVLVGNDRRPYCFTHEREYADRYGSEDIHALSQVGPSSWWRNGRHSSGADLAEYLRTEYDGA